ncbi:MAG: hypothetical protein PSW75_04620, partial [bacterium]|nr:hypothetical protein [bacterium]
MKKMRWVGWSKGERAALLLLLVVLAGCGTPLPPQVIVVGDVPATGQEARQPDAEHPVYYFPLAVGFKEVGAIVAGEKPPQKNDVSHALAVALAKRHYLVMNAVHAPEQLLVFWWGSMNPQIENFGSNDPADQVFFNEREMLALVGAYKAGGMGWKSGDLRTAARDDRYFVIVMAFDFAEARQHRKKLLWMTKMSTESVGTDLSSVIPALITSGGPAFGRDTTPDWIDSGKPQKVERVILGPTEIKEYVP